MWDRRGRRIIHRIFFRAQRIVERRFNLGEEEKRWTNGGSKILIKRRSRGRVKVKHLERRLKARLALDALDCLIFRLRAMLRVAGKNTRRRDSANRFEQHDFADYRSNAPGTRAFDRLRPRKSFQFPSNGGHIFHSNRWYSSYCKRDDCLLEEKRNNVVMDREREREKSY